MGGRQAVTVTPSNRSEEWRCRAAVEQCPQRPRSKVDLKATGFDAPMVFLSDRADTHMSVRAMKAGAVEFLTKPVRHQDLLEAIEAFVAARRA